VGARRNHRDLSPGRPRTWYQRWPARYAAEQAIVSAHPSALTMAIDHQRRLVLIEGKLRYPTPGGSVQSVRIRITLAENHPFAPPIADDVETRFPRTAEFHKIPGTDHLCLWFYPEAEWESDVGALDLYLSQVVLHVHRQLVYEADPSHRWPGPELPHTRDDAFRTLLEEAVSSEQVVATVVESWTGRTTVDLYGLCPCGLGRKWKWCHRPVVVELERKCGIDRLTRAFSSRSLDAVKEVS
jgi:hypothetical protein